LRIGIPITQENKKIILKIIRFELLGACGAVQVRIPTSKKNAFDLLLDALISELFEFPQ
jgi:hypothetical protein